MSNFDTAVYGLGDAGWQFGSVSRRPFDALNLDDRANVAEWLPAVVPGNVRADLLASERIPDPFFDDCYRASLWVEACDWWYRRWLDASIGPDQRAFLIFDGIDYLGAVFVNGQELGRHQGMFSRQVYEVTEALRDGARTPGGSELAVRLWGSGALPGRRLNRLERGWARLADRLDPTGVGAFPDRMAAVKCQMSFGWDFAPPIRTMGIWDDVWLVVTGGVLSRTYGSSQTWTPPQSSAGSRMTVDSDQPRLFRPCAGVSANFEGLSWPPIF